MTLKFTIRSGPGCLTMQSGVKFNRGDCLKVLAYHDDLHIGQAKSVLTAIQS
jgi:hypothetical protein